MATTIARASDPSDIADTMPTTKMSSGDAADGVKTVAVGDAPPFLPHLLSAQKPANSGTADGNVAAAAVLEPHTRPSCVRNPPSKYLDNIGGGATLLKQPNPPNHPLQKYPLHPNQIRKQPQLLIPFNPRKKLAQQLV